MKVHLRVIEGPDTGRVFTFEVRDRFMIGRAPTAHFQLAQDPYFSRHHAMLEIDPPNVMVQDLKSTNGTRVNNAPIQAPTPLRHGDSISGGQSRIQIALEEDAVAATVQHSSPQVAPVVSPSPLAAGSASEKVAVRCLRCGTRAANEQPRARAEQMAYFCDGCLVALLDEPKVLPDYQVIKELGRGGMGAVYLATHKVLGVRALKVILPKAAMSQKARDMFVREAMSQARLDHPRVVRVLDFQEPARGIFCMVMEYVEGVGADKLVEASPAGIAPALAAEIVIQALEGLAHAHERGIVHRDVKDANLLVSHDARGTMSVKLLDFGLAKSYETSGASGFTKTGDLAGTIPYMAPEQILNFREAKPPADLYSMGAALYHLVTKQVAYNFSNNVDPLVTILESEIVPVRSRNPSVPAPIAAVIEKAMRKDLAQRYRSADEMRAALMSALQA